MFSIGEFSRITGLPVRTLRFYHEKNVLVPAAVERATGYRSYDAANVELARTIVALRGLDFSLDEIVEIVADCQEDADLIAALQRQREKLKAERDRRQDMIKEIDHIIRVEQAYREEIKMSDQQFQIEERDLPPTLVAGIRMRGKYSDCGQGFSRLGRKAGRYAAGKPLMLCYDSEYREDDADFEPCFPLRKEMKLEEIDVRELPGGRAVTLVHKGPYDRLSQSYEKLLSYVHEKGYEVQRPTREVYLRGPGMIFKGNPKKYLTEIQMLVTNGEGR